MEAENRHPLELEYNISTQSINSSTYNPLTARSDSQNSSKYFQKDLMATYQTSPEYPLILTNQNQVSNQLIEPNRIAMMNRYDSDFEATRAGPIVERASSTGSSERNLVQVMPIEVDQLGQTSHRVIVDGDALTLVILDCSPQPPQLDSRGHIGGAQSADSASATSLQANECSCQAELIVRHHHHHHHHNDSPNHHFNLSDQRSEVNRSGSGSRDHLREHQHSLRLGNFHDGDRSRSVDLLNYADQQQQQQQHYNHMQQEAQQGHYAIEHRNDSQFLTINQSSRNVYDNNNNYSNTNNMSSDKRYNQQEELVRVRRSESSQSEIRDMSQGTDQQDEQSRPSSDLEPNQLPPSPRPGYRLVKRWDWKSSKFIWLEVPDKFSQQQQQQALSTGSDIQQSSSKSPEVRSLSQDRSFYQPTPSTSQQDPRESSYGQEPNSLKNSRNEDTSWLANRIPDMDSVQSDPLYRDLMLELQKLEENVTAKPIEIIYTAPESTERPVFTQTVIPQEAEVDEYENIEFICHLTPVSDPTMSVQWYLNGQPVKESSRILNENDFGIVRLRITRCEAEDSGIYQCFAKNRVGEATTSATLRVNSKDSVQYESLNPTGLEKIMALENPQQVKIVEESKTAQPPKFLTHIIDYVEKDEGQSLHLECCLGPVDDPDLKTEWLFNGRPLVTGSRFHTIDDFGFVVLDIDWLFPRDTGEYICRATNKHGTDITRTVLLVKPDKNIVLDSQVDNPDLADKLRQLEFPDVVHQEFIEEPGKPVHFVQQVNSEANKHRFEEGENAHFEARVAPASDGNLTVEWYHNDKPLMSGHRFRPAFDFGHITLDILYVYPEDSGVYKCVARNSMGTDVSQIEIHVNGKPSLDYHTQLPEDMVGGVQKLTDMEAMWNRAPDPEEEEAPMERTPPEFVLKPIPYNAFEGSCARFCCRLTGHPRPRITWTINGQVIVSGSRYKLTYDGMHHLTIPKCQLSDAGKIEVYAKNPLGDCIAGTQLRVRPKVDDYRSVLKRSPNPWYDEQVLQAYRRQRLAQDNDDDNEPQLMASPLIYGNEKRLTLQPSVSSYMEPGTPDVNLLTGTPLLEPGDLHPSVVEQQVVKAPAPSTIKRAMVTKDDVKISEVSNISNDKSDSRLSPTVKEAPAESDPKRQVFGLRKNLRNDRVAVERPQIDAAKTKSSSEAQQDRIEVTKNEIKDQPQPVQQRESSVEPGRAGSVPPSPENMVREREIHSHTQKQTQFERRANKEIKREIIEREVFEQEHKGVTRENLVRSNSVERGSSQAREIDANQQRQVHFNNDPIYIEDNLIPPEFTQKIQPCQAIDGDEARFECCFIGDPPPTITWYRESKMLKPSNLFNIITDMKDQRSTLIIRRVSVNANAVFTVKAENVAGSAKSSANLIVEAHPLPESSRGGRARQIDAEHFSFNEIESSQGSKGAEELRNQPRPNVKSTSASTVRQALAQASSSGKSSEEVKQVTSEVDSADNKIIRSVKTRTLSPNDLTALIRASPEGLIAPTFLHTLHDVINRPGELVRLDARLLGSQPMEVKWLRDGQRVRADRLHKMLLEGDLYTLLILECTAQDEGIYECIATNGVGESSCKAKVTISQGRGSTPSSHYSDEGLQGRAEIPKVIKKLENQQVAEGRPVTLRCQISAFPVPEVQWFKHDQLIKPSKYFRIFKDNEETYCLRIMETFQEDQGEYRCVARTPNGRGQVETSATISVDPMK